MRTVLCLLLIATLSCFTPAEDFGDIEINTRKRLGSGFFGVVFEAVSRKTGKTYAVKKLTCSDKDAVLMATNEYESLKTVTENDLANVVKLRFFDLQFGRYFYYGFDLFKGGDLNSFISKEVRPEIRAKYAERIAYGLLRGLAGIHSVEVGHFDIRPHNILLDENFEPAITDFGLSESMRGGRTITVAKGYASYSAPEMTRMKGYDEKADVWSMGKVISNLFAGLDESQGSRNRKVPKKWLYLRDDCPIDFKNIVENYMLVADPAERASSQYIFDNLVHGKQRKQSLFEVFFGGEKANYGMTEFNQEEAKKERFCIREVEGKLIDC